MGIADYKARTPQEALESFEKAAIWKHITDGLPKNDDMRKDSLSKYESAREELLTWMSYIP